MKKHLFTKFLSIILIVLFGFNCTTKHKQSEPDRLQVLKEMEYSADLAYQAGSYFSLIKAEEIYSTLAANESLSSQIHHKLLKTIILLSLRSRELGIPSSIFEEKTTALFKTNPSLSGMEKYFNILRGIRSSNQRVKGQQSRTDEITFMRYFNWIERNANQLNENLKKEVSEDAFFAYLLLYFYENFNSWIKEKLDIEIIAKLYAETPLIKFKLALFPEINTERLKEMFSEYPDFHEIHFFLGSFHLSAGEILSAEKHFKQTEMHFPDSIACLMGLSRINFALEEYTECIEIYDKVLVKFPSYQDAILGKTICLSYLGKHEEALPLCEKIREIGRYFMGESLYWSAWNLHQLNLNEQAAIEIEKAKTSLLNNYEVLLLSGLIDYSLYEFESAEENFKKVLKIQSLDPEAGFHLGQIYSNKNMWEESGRYFHTAAKGGIQLQNGLEQKILELQESELSEPRKNRLLQKKTIQLERVKLEAATAFYNAGASLFNAGLYKEATSCASKAYLHPSFRDMSDELLRKLEKRQP